MTPISLFIDLLFGPDALSTAAQISAGINFLNTLGDKPATVDDLKKASGYGVVVTEDQIKQQVWYHY